MGMSFNVKIVYGFELPEDSNADEEFYGDDIEVHGEGEIGTRKLLGVQLDYFDIHHECCAPLVIDLPPAKVCNRLRALAVELGCEEPKIWTIGSID